MLFSSRMANPAKNFALKKKRYVKKNVSKKKKKERKKLDYDQIGFGKTCCCQSGQSSAQSSDKIFR